MKLHDVICIATTNNGSSGIAPALSSNLPQRRIVLVDLFWTRDKDPRVPLGHASLLAALHADAAGRDVRSVVIAVNAGLSIRAIANKILWQAGRLPDKDVDIAIGAYIWNEEILQSLLPLLRARGFFGRIILGGPQISYVGSGLEKIYPDADVFIRGHAETALCMVARNRESNVHVGVHYAGEMDVNEQARTTLAELPSPWLSGLIALKDQAFLRWETQRGCQFKCSFCQHRQPDARIKPAYFSGARINDEIDHICRMQVKEVAVLDPVFNSSEQAGHALRVLARFAENDYKGKLALQCRAELIDDAFLDAAQRLDVCLEFGLQTVHKAECVAIDRPNCMDIIDAVLAKVRLRNIRHEVSLIFGLPEQTLDSFKESVRWFLDRKVPVIKAFPLLLLRGTKLELERERWSLIVGDGAMPMVVASRTFGRHEWQAMQRISEALSDTEGRHPPLAALTQQALLCDPDNARWQPVNRADAS